MPEKIGRYEIKKELGRGGMATVYLAYDPRFRRDVAIKVLPPQFTHDPRFMARFEQEGQTIAALEDPAIVPVYDFGEQDNAPYIVMRYMSGGSLRDRLDGGPLPLEQITTILQRLAPALDEAHRRGIIHRDIKPDNVLFDHKDRPYLGDFGIARMAEVTRTMTITGTPSYMSPEQWKGEPKADWRVDIYALGVMLFEMLTGSRPYESDTPSTQMYKHVLEPVPNVLALNPNLPPEVQDVIEMAMAKDREQRFRSAGEMVEGLASLRMVGGESIAGPVQEGIASAAALEETLLEPLPAARPGLPPERPPVKQAPPMDRPPPPRGSGAAAEGLPAWIWWAGAAVVLLMLIFGIRAAFFGGDNPEPAAEEVALPEFTAAPTREPTPAPTNTSQPTDTPTAQPSSTPTVDPDQPPPDPELGLTWQRPQDGMTMVFVPAGSFLMGSEDGGSNEQPVHEVALDGFWIDRTEVTNEQFGRFVGDTGFETTAEIEGSGWIFVGDSWEGTAGADWQHPQGPGSELSGLGDHPVVLLSWEDADAYCEWAGGRLPSEAQWEYAARGPDSLIYPLGNAFDGDRANFCDQNCLLDWNDDSVDDGYEQTAPAGSYEDGASWVGARDMAGNVWEWVNDWYDDNYYSTSPAANPEGPSSGISKVLRGGSRGSDAYGLRSAYRHLNPPSLRLDNVGFRCSLPGE